MVNFTTIWLWLAVAAGGAFGSVLRYGVTLFIHARATVNFPIATMLINIIGSLIMGVIFVVLLERFADNNALRLFLIVGLLGGFTTFSTFSLDVILMIERGDWLNVCIYIMGSVFISIGALMAGFFLARFFLIK